MKTALYRWYTKQDKTRVKSLQGKVFEVDGKLIFYRDVHEHKGRLWTNDGAWNLDMKTYDWLRIHKVKEVHYFWTKNKKLYRITMGMIRNRLKKGAIDVKKLHGHTQMFIPVYSFKKTVRNYPVPWIKKETDVGKIEPIDIDVTYDSYIIARKRMADDFMMNTKAGNNPKNQEIKVAYTYIQCANCSGYGTKGFNKTICPSCKGSGVLRVRVRNDGGT